MDKDNLIVYREVSRGENKDFKIKIGSIYYVDNKIDYDAPDGFQEERTSKVPSVISGAKTVNLVAEDPRRSTSNPESLEGKYYDTALTKDSKRLKELFETPEELGGHLEKLQEYIIKPMEELYGEGVLSPRNSEFWTSLRGYVKIYKNKFFDTNDTEQLLQLYCLLINHELAPIEFEKRSAYQFSQYTVKNYEDTSDSASKNALDRSKAVYSFMQQLDKDPEGVGYMLEYIGMPGVAGFTGKTELNMAFNMYLDGELQNISSFLRDMEFLQSRTGKEVLEIYKQLHALEDKNLLDKVGSEYFLDGEEIGIKLRDAANKVSSDKNLRLTLSELYKKIKK